MRNKLIKLSVPTFTVLAILTACIPDTPVNLKIPEKQATSSVLSKTAITGKTEFPEVITPVNTSSGYKRDKNGVAYFAGNSSQSSHTSPWPLSKGEKSGRDSSLTSPSQASSIHAGSAHHQTFGTKATLSDIAPKATVSIIYPPDAGDDANKVVATGLTDDSGIFTINPDNSFSPANGSIFVLEAVKRIGAAGNSVMTIRTYIKRNGSGWDSMTTPGVYINTKTTALSVIDIYDNSIIPDQTINKIAISGTAPNLVSTPSAVGSVTVSTINSVADIVTTLLTENVDPVQNIGFLNNKYFIKKEPNHSVAGVIATHSCPGCDLKYENLSNKNFSSGDLSNANFTGANLTGANLFNATLTGATFTGADLSGTQWFDGFFCNIGSIGTCSPHLGEYRANTVTFGQQSAPSVAMDKDGNFIVVWATNSDEIYAFEVGGKKFSSAGIPLNPVDIPINTYTSNAQVAPKIAMDSDGSFVVVWQSFNQEGEFSDWGIFGQRYSSVGDQVGTEFQINTYTTANQTNPAIAMDNNGDFVVAWQSGSYGALGNQDGAGYGIFAQKYNKNGARVGFEFQVNSYTSGYQQFPSIAIDADGDFIIAWDGSGPGDVQGIFAKIFYAEGLSQENEFKVNTVDASQETNPSVAMDDYGDFVVTWTSASHHGLDDQYYGIFGQRFSASLVAQGSEFQVNSYTTNSQQYSSVSMDNEGNFVVVWQSLNEEVLDAESITLGFQPLNGIFGQRFSADGSDIGGEFQVNGVARDQQTSANVKMDKTGNFIVTWQSYGQDGSFYGISVKRYNSSGQSQ